MVGVDTYSSVTSVEQSKYTSNCFSLVTRARFGLYFLGKISNFFSSFVTNLSVY